MMSFVWYPGYHILYINTIYVIIKISYSYCFCTKGILTLYLHSENVYELIFNFFYLTICQDNSDSQQINVVYMEKYYADNTPLGSCVICDNNTKLVGKICKRCNKGLSKFDYNIDTLKKSVLYLEDNPKK